MLGSRATPRVVRRNNGGVFKNSAIIGCGGGGGGGGGGNGGFTALAAFGLGGLGLDFEVRSSCSSCRCGCCHEMYVGFEVIIVL